MLVGLVSTAASCFLSLVFNEMQDMAEYRIGGSANAAAMFNTYTTTGGIVCAMHAAEVLGNVLNKGLSGKERAT